MNVYSYSGTKKFRVEVADTASGPWRKLVDSSLIDPRTYAEYSCEITEIEDCAHWQNHCLHSVEKCSCPTCQSTRHNVPIENFDVGEQVGRYIKFVCDSYHGDITCALHSIQFL